MRNTVQYVIDVLLRPLSRVPVLNRLRTRKEPKLASRITVGRHTYGINERSLFSVQSPDQPAVSIGNYCSVAPGAVILANADHPTHLPSLYPFRTVLYAPDKKRPLNVDVTSRGPVEIGHDVWIGANAIILSGVSIGSGAVIGAGAIVTKDIPPYAIAVGNPARVIRYRFSPDIIQQLLEVAWRFLSDEKIKELEPYFYSDDMNAFLSQVRLIKNREDMRSDV
jgi:acetyltransferase-like isoleucine patch superfamily enzyme